MRERERGTARARARETEGRESSREGGGGGGGGVMDGDRNLSSARDILRRGAFNFKSTHGSIRQHIISIRQHSLAYVSIRQLFLHASVSVFVFLHFMCTRTRDVR